MEQLKKYKFDFVQPGTANNIPDFFDRIIKPQFSKLDCIIQTHESLMKYIKSDKLILFLRLYGSFSKDNYDMLRRGFLTEYSNGDKMVFCDNTFAMLFTGLKVAGVSYSELEIRNLLNQSHLITSFSQTENERELCYYTPKKAIRANLNSKGWYLAHIKPVGYGFDNFNLRDLFPNPPRKEWDANTKIRKVENNLSEYKKKVLIAHFLRLIHPLNSFLVPKPSQLNYSGRNIGEENELLAYVKSYLQSTFPKEYQEYNELSFDYNFENSNSKIENIKWSDKQKNGNRTDNEKKFKKAKLKNVIDENDYELVEKLDQWLASIGKDVFIEILYPELKQNINVSFDEIAAKNVRYAGFSENSQRNRLSSARSIIKLKLDSEALQLVIDSNRLSESIRILAKKYLDQFENE